MWVFFAILCTACWAIVNVLDSSVVHNHERTPMALMWSQSLVSLPILFILSFLLPLPTPWIFPLLVFGVLGYFGDLWFFHVLGHLDVSVTNLAWSLLSLLLALAGFLLFDESWGTYQSVGAALIVLGALTLSFYHANTDLRRVLSLLTVLGVLYMPYYILKKFVIEEGVDPATVFFWMILGREMTSFSASAFITRIRRAALAAIGKTWHFMAINAAVVSTFFLAEYFGALAYETGPISLVSIVSNIQPFLVIAFAWIFSLISPRNAPKELLTFQSVRVKVLCFTVVFAGLALLSVHG